MKWCVSGIYPGGRNMWIFFVLLIVSYYVTNSCFGYGEVPSELAKFLCLVRALEPVSRKSRQLTVRARKAVFMFAVFAFKVKISIILKNDRMKLLVNEAKLRERVASGSAKDLGVYMDATLSFDENLPLSSSFTVEFLTRKAHWTNKPCIIQKGSYASFTKRILEALLQIHCKYLDNLLIYIWF